MKLLFLCGALTAITCTNSWGRVITVNNNANSPAQYRSLDTAAMNANAVDTLLVHGSATTYGNVTVNKRLVIMGAGYSPRKERPISTKIDEILLNSTAIGNANGSVIRNCHIDRIRINYVPENIVLQHNQLGTINADGNNWLIEHNIISQITTGTRGTSGFIKNNFFLRSDANWWNASSLIGTSCVLTNNIFANLNNNPFSYFFYTLKNTIVANNIFYMTAPFDSMATNQISANSFSNNLTFSSINNTFTGGIGNTVGSTNIINQNPLFNTNLSGVNEFNYNLDFRLQASSPGHNSGTDGMDLGMFGGTTPMTYPLSGEPKLGIVKSMNITNTIVPVGGTLNVKITAKTRN